MKLFAPAYPNEDAFYCRFFTEVSSLRDAAGRPLHEVDFREGGDAYTRCPFHDSRRGYLMNKAALTQITSEWAEILNGVRFYTWLFEGSAPRDLARAWRISLASMFAPLYLIHRGTNPYADGALPTPLSGVFKIMLDVPTTLDLMVLNGWRDSIATACGPMQPTEIQNFADSHLILLNGEYACAGAPGLIQSVVGILFSEGRDDHRFATYLGDREEFLTFCYLMSCQYVVGLLYLHASAIAMERAFSFCNGQGVPIESPMSAYERRRRFALAALAGRERYEGAFRGLCALVADERGWGLDVGKRWVGDSSLHEALEFLDRIATADAVEISHAHALFESRMAVALSSLQMAITRSIGAKAMFSAPFSGCDDPRNPARILQSRLHSAGLC